MAERDEGSGGCNLGDGLSFPSSSHSNRTYSYLRARQTWMQVIKEVRCRDVNKEMSPECKDRDQHGLVRNGFLNNKRLCNSQARVPSYGCASMPGGPRSGDFPNLGVNPMSYQGNMPSGPVGASLGGLTPQAAQIQEVMAMLGSMTSTTLHTSLAQVNSQLRPSCLPGP